MLTSPQTNTKHMLDKSTTAPIVCTSIPNPISELIQGPFILLTTQRKHILYINTYLYTFRGLYKSSKYYRCYNRDCKSGGILVDDLFELRKSHDPHENHERLFTILSNKYALQNGTSSRITSPSPVDDVASIEERNDAERGHNSQASPLPNINSPSVDIEKVSPVPQFMLSQKGKSLLYVDSYFYHRTNAFKGKTYYKCRTRHCPARGIMGQSFYLTKAHNHPDDREKHLIMTFVAEIKAAIAENPEKSFKNAYYEVLDGRALSERTLLAKTSFHVIARKLKKSSKRGKPSGQSDTSSDEISGSSDFCSEDEASQSNFVSDDLLKLFSDNTTQTLFGLY